MSLILIFALNGTSQESKSKSNILPVHYDDVEDPADYAEVALTPTSKGGHGVGLGLGSGVGSTDSLGADDDDNKIGLLGEDPLYASTSANATGTGKKKDKKGKRVAPGDESDDD